MTAARQQPLFHWFIPIDGDGSRLGTRRAERPPDFEYLARVVQTAEAQEFHGLLIPTRFVNGLFDEGAPLMETWTTATALAAVTQRIRFLIAVRPGFIAAGLLAKMVATLDQISGGRVDINIVPGGIRHDFERLGVDSDHAGRYEEAEELMHACRVLWEGGLTDFAGRHVTLRGARCAPGPFGNPRFYQGGASPRAEALAARQADVYLLWIEPLEAIAARIERVQAAFSANGRVPAFGLRTHLVVRDDADEAWEAAHSLIADADPDVLRQRQAVGNGGLLAAAGGDPHRLGERLWSGLSTVRVNCGSALVGTPQQVAEELYAYWKLGVDEFILSGFPHVEESVRVREAVLPRLRACIAAASSERQP
ncbi:MAG: LLM class flavin-dependent oxidoreductase [Candidatus Tectomicrobia bacterium]|nr:LLM class flavin-dependent oxidoreductase [Candidatus Tectomicrobia bacterium]